MSDDVVSELVENIFTVGIDNSENHKTLGKGLQIQL